MNGQSDGTAWLSTAFWKDVWRDTVQWAVEALPKVLVVILLSLVLLRFLDFAAKRISRRATNQGGGVLDPESGEHRKRIETTVGIFKKVGVVTIWCFAVVLVLMQVGVDVAPIIAGAGIVGLAVGFGAQELVRDVISGFFMLLENHIRTGDVAVINGQGGLVESVGLRTVVLRDLAGVVHVVQNGKIETLSNMTKEWSAMVFEIRVAYDQDVDEVIGVMKEVAEGLQQDPAFEAKILEPMEVFGVESLGEDALIIKARIKTLPIEQWSVGREYRRRLKQAFDERRIQLPLPQRTLHWGGASEPVQLRAGGALGLPHAAPPKPEQDRRSAPPRPFGPERQSDRPSRVAAKPDRTPEAPPAKRTPLPPPPPPAARSR